MNISDLDIQQSVHKDRRSGKDGRVTDDTLLDGPDRRSRKERRSGAERRKQVRLRVQDGAFAALSVDHHIVGPIQNISSDGLAFRYISRKRQIHETEVDIFYVGMGWCLTKVPSKTIYDFRIHWNVSDTSLMIQKRGIQFGELENDQTYHLENFIQRYAVGDYDTKLVVTPPASSDNL